MKTLSNYRYRPSDSREVTREGVDAVVYVQDTPRPTAIGYRGKSNKHVFNNWFRTPEERDKKIAAFFDDTAACERMREARKAAAAAERAALTNESLPLGTVMVNSWGYDQTNVDFYEVVALKGKKSVMLRAIAQRTVEGSEGMMCEDVLPVPGHYMGEPFPAMMSTPTYVSMGKDGCAGKWSGRPMYQSHYA